MNFSFLPILLLRHFCQWLFTRNGKVVRCGCVWNLPPEGRQIVANVSTQVFLIGTVRRRFDMFSLSGDRIICRIGTRCVSGEFYDIGEDSESGFSIVFGTKPGMKFLEVFYVSATGEQHRIFSVLLNCKTVEPEHVAATGGDFATVPIVSKRCHIYKITQDGKPRKTCCSIVIPLHAGTRMMYYFLSLVAHTGDSAEYELIFVAIGCSTSCDALRIAGGLNQIFAVPFGLITTGAECSWRQACETGAEYATNTRIKFLPSGLTPHNYESFQQLLTQFEEPSQKQCE